MGHSLRSTTPVQRAQFILLITLARGSAGTRVELAKANALPDETIGNHGRSFFFARTPIAKSTITGAKTSTGIGHNTELTSFLMALPSRCQSTCHRLGFWETRSLPFERHGKAPWPSLEMKSSHSQTTSSLNPYPGSVYAANGTRCGRDLLPITVIQWVTQKR